MTKKVSGERSLKVGGGTVTLRFSIQSIMALEDHFGGAIFELLPDRFGSGTPRLGDIIILYGASRGIDPGDSEGLEGAYAELQKAGFEAAMPVLMECLTASLSGPNTGKPQPAQTKGEARRKSKVKTPT